MGDRVAQLAVLVEATGEQIVLEAGLHLLELSDQRLGLLDGCVYRVEDLGDAALLVYGKKRHVEYIEEFSGHSTLACRPRHHGLGFAPQYL
jgi:hypothetical protein